jgi:phage gp36-like protein
MYATIQDMIDRYSQDEITLAFDTDQGGTLDETTANKALEDATAEIDGYLVGRYDTPLSSPPAVLVRLAVDIALYRGSILGAQTEEKRTRYEDAVRFLTKVAQGDISLGLEKPSQGGSGGASFVASPRLMGRGRMDGLL